MTQARRAREQASPGCQVHRRPNSRVLSACHSLPRQQKSNLSSSLSQAELPVLCFAFMGTDLYTNSEWPETPNPAASAWDYWCVPAVLTSWFCFWFFFFAKEGSGSGEEEATVELHRLCLQYIRFSAVAEHSAWALSPSCHSAVNCKARTVTPTFLSGAL